MVSRWKISKNLNTWKWNRRFRRKYSGGHMQPWLLYRKTNGSKDNNVQRKISFKQKILFRISASKLKGKIPIIAHRLFMMNSSATACYPSKISRPSCRSNRTGELMQPDWLESFGKKMRQLFQGSRKLPSSSCLQAQVAQSSNDIFPKFPPCCLPEEIELLPDLFLSLQWHIISLHFTKRWKLTTRNKIILKILIVWRN